MTRRLTVAIATYRRPERLARAIDEVADALGELADVDGEILVVDNDPDGSAAPVARAVRYVLEPEPGLSAARNRALDEAAGADLLVFIDDDERPTPGWLPALLRVLDECGADAVAGRVVTDLPTPIDPWLTAVGAFVRPTRIDRQVMPQAATNNLLLRMPAVRASGVRFDPRFGTTGGEDSLFTLQFSRSGYVIRWAQDAVVVEDVLPQRVDRHWILMRAYRNGTTSARLAAVLATGRAGRIRARAASIAGGLLRVAAGGARWLLGVPCRSLRWRSTGMRAMYRGAGFVAGALGRGYEEYARR